MLLLRVEHVMICHQVFQINQGTASPEPPAVYRGVRGVEPPAEHHIHLLVEIEQSIHTGGAKNKYPNGLET